MMYAWDEDVRQKTEDLYIAILETIEALTEWLYRSSRMLLSSVSQCQKLTLHPVGESLKALFEQGDYGKEFEEKLSANL